MGLILFLCLVYLIYINLKNKKDITYSTLLISIVFLTILVGIILSILIRPIFISRYIIPALGGLWLGFSILLDNISINKKMYNVIIIIVLLISIVGIISFYDISSSKYSETIENQELLHDINQTDIIVFNDKLSYLRYSPYISSENQFHEDIDEILNRFNGTIYVFDKFKEVNQSNTTFEKIGVINQDDVYIVKKV